MRLQRLLAWVSMIGLLAALGCGGRSRKPLSATIPTHGDATAQAQFRQAQQRFERDGDGMDAFAAIAESYPSDPIAPYARLYAGMAALAQEELEQAVSHLQLVAADVDVEPRLRERAQLFLGIAYNYQGDHQRALPLLIGAKDAVETEGERLEWLAATALASSRGPEPLASLPYFDAWYPLARRSEQAFILEQVGAVVAAADVEAAQRAWESLQHRDGIATAVLGPRVAGDYATQGDPGRAARIRADVEDARRRLGLSARAGQGAGGEPDLLGSIVDVTGKRSRRGDLVVSGLSIASGTFAPAASDRPGELPKPFRVTVHDTASGTGGAAAAVDAALAEGAIAIVGPLSGPTVDAASVRASEVGVPLVTLNPRPEARTAGASEYIFHVVHSAEARAQALARYASEHGVRDFAILAPQSGYGRTVGAAFRQEVERLGGQVVVEERYPEAQTSFGEHVKRLSKPWQAVFVPDQAARLELIAPALAAGNLVAQPIDAAAPAHGRKILLLSTAEFLAPRYTRSAGRYSAGAVLAPGFYPDRNDAQVRAFVDRYEQAFGKSPTAIDAYTYDAALALRRAIEGGARTRVELAAAMAAGSVAGVTGTVRFDGLRRRGDDGLLFLVQKDEVDGDYEIRALRPR